VTWTTRMRVNSDTAVLPSLLRNCGPFGIMSRPYVPPRGASLIVRFGGIADRKAEPLDIIRESLENTSWRVSTVEPAGSAAGGRRQSLHFGRADNQPREEYDLWATLIGD
jgi:hypothetical protein